MPIKGKKLIDKAYIYTMEDCIDQMLYFLENGKEKGSTTFIPQLDMAWKWRMKECNMWAGYSNEGKSRWLKFITLIKSLEENWNAVWCSPEDFPPENFYDDFIHTLTGFTTDKDNPMCVSKEIYNHAYEVLRGRFHFIYLRQGYNTVPDCLTEFQKIIDQFDTKICIVDPLMKFSRPKDAPERDDLYAAYLASNCSDFARENNISLNLVTHQVTPKREGPKANYPKPSMYSIKGGGSYADLLDNVLLVQRPNYATDKLDTLVEITSDKIKEQKLVGIPQTVSFRFDRKSNRYLGEHHEPLYNFDKWFDV